MKRRMIIAAAVSAAITGVLSSCNVTRVITNESRYLTRGDTAVVIQTKTIESYDARRE